MNRIEQLEGRTLFASYAAANVTELIAATNAANASAEADTITLAAGTTFSLTAAADNNATNGATGLPVVAAGGGALTIAGSGAVIEQGAANGTPAFRLFSVEAGASLALQDLTVRGGGGNSYYAPGQGAGIYSQGSLTLSNAIVENNVARGVSSNWGLAGTPAQGGGIYSGGTLVVTNSIIRSNTAVGGDGSDAYSMKGFINLPAVPAADGSGGGIFIAGGAAFINSTTIGSNTARGGFGGRTVAGGNGYGGGLYAAAGVLTIRNSPITANAAQGGSGLVWKRGTLVPGNEGTGIGGGIYINAVASAGLDSFTFENTTDNSASSSSRDIFGRYTRLA